MRRALGPLYPSIRAVYGMTWDEVLSTPFDLLWRLVCDLDAMTDQRREVVAYALFS